MKRFFIISHFFLALLLFSCEKDDVKKDYRSAFIGTYDVIETTTCYGSFGDCFYEKDTIIIVTRGENDSTINVLGRTLAIGTDGITGDYHYGLHFRNDSIFSYYMSGGLGGGHYIRHEGLRISKKVS